MALSWRSHGALMALSWRSHGDPGALFALFFRSQRQCRLRWNGGAQRERIEIAEVAMRAHRERTESAMSAVTSVTVLARLHSRHESAVDGDPTMTTGTEGVRACMQRAP
ncbi:hypothetical protein Bbelb_389450 [Branchiostoma belcheri]|nr:hypothetical protein Bbelb_389450 [Branchiostoma belcheri]